MHSVYELQMTEVDHYIYSYYLCNNKKKQITWILSKFYLQYYSFQLAQTRPMPLITSPEIHNAKASQNVA